MRGLELAPPPKYPTCVGGRAKKSVSSLASEKGQWLLGNYIRLAKHNSRKPRSLAQFKVLNRYSVTSCSGLACVTSAEVELGWMGVSGGLFVFRLVAQ